VTGDGARWQYVILWRYGALILVLIGLAMLGVGASGVQGEPISMTLISLGFASTVGGVVLPRIEGKFTAGRGLVAADLLAVHKLDQVSMTTSAPAVLLREVQTPAGLAAIEAAQPPGAITLGDAWDALDAAGVYPKSDPAKLNHQAVFEGVGLGSAYFRLADGRELKMPNRGFVDYGAASDELLALLATWGIRPTASGKYPVPDSRYRWIASLPPVFFIQRDDDGQLDG
jgi:hypothetical protein